MKKLITLLLVLTGMVTTAMAVDKKTATIYVRAAVQPNLWAWEASNEDDHLYGDTWPGEQMEAVSGRVGWYKADIEYTCAYKLIFSYNKANQTANIGGDGLDSRFVYYNYDKDNVNGASNHSVYQLDIRYDYGGWNTTPLVLSPTANAFEWTGTMDLTETVADQNFKLVTSPDITGDLNWVGVGGLTLTDEGSLVDTSDTNIYNFKLLNHNKSYQTYDFTVQKGNDSADKPYAMTVAGKDDRDLATITDVFLWTGATNVTLSKVGETNSYTGTLDLSNLSSTILFKLVVNDGGDEGDGWAGWIGNNNLAIDAPTGWTGAEGDYTNANLTLLHGTTGFKSYTITATWDSNNYYHKNWTLTIAGENQSSHTIYYANPTSGTFSYSTPYIYTFGPETAGEWGGTAMSPTSKTLAGKDVYSWTGVGDAPANVIFSDNKANQTADLTFYKNIIYSENDIVGVAVTIGEAKFATFSSGQDLDFTGTGVDAYIASDIDDDKVVLTKHNKLPKTNGVLLKTNAAGTYFIPTAASTDAITTNYLTATVSDTQVAASTSGAYHYFLANGANGVGFYKIANDTYSAAGKAYLATTTALTDESSPSARVAWIFDDGEVTGIETVKQSVKTNNEYFNIAGQRVAQPTKGLYIVNGKKVIIK